MRESSANAKRYLIDGIDYSHLTHLIEIIEKYAPELLSNTTEMQEVRAWLRQYTHPEKANYYASTEDRWVVILYYWAKSRMTQDKMADYESDLAYRGKNYAEREQIKRERLTRWEHLSKREKQRKLERVMHRLDDLMQELDDDHFPDSEQLVGLLSSYDFFQGMGIAQQMEKLAAQYQEKSLEDETLMDVLKAYREHCVSQHQCVVSPPRQQGNADMKRFVRWLANNYNGFFTRPMPLPMVASVASACYPDTPCTTDDIKNWKKTKK